MSVSKKNDCIALFRRRDQRRGASVAVQAAMVGLARLIGSVW